MSLVAHPSVVYSEPTGETDPTSTSVPGHILLVVPHTLHRLLVLVHVEPIQGSLRVVYVREFVHSPLDTALPTFF
jgi:hypothetical protein